MGKRNPLDLLPGTLEPLIVETLTCS